MWASHGLHRTLLNDGRAICRAVGQEHCDDEKRKFNNMTTRIYMKDPETKHCGGVTAFAFP